jgi:hypothetical protein
MRRSWAQHSANDGDDLPGSFSPRINYLGKSLAKAAVVIDLGEPKVFKWHVSQTLDAPRDGELPRPHIFQEPLYVLFVHRS